MNISETNKYYDQGTRNTNRQGGGGRCLFDLDFRLDGFSLALNKK
jgi:hypothetical protein